jgi:hypothetical protein
MKRRLTLVSIVAIILAIVLRRGHRCRGAVGSSTDERRRGHDDRARAPARRDREDRSSIRSFNRGSDVTF